MRKKKKSPLKEGNQELALLRGTTRRPKKRPETLYTLGKKQKKEQHSPGGGGGGGLIEDVGVP